MSLLALSADYNLLKADAADLKKQTSIVSDKLKKIEASLIEEMIASDLTSFKNQYGNFSLQRRTSYKVPQTAEERDALFEYMQSKGVYDTMRTVNSATLNSWARLEWDAAAEEGNMEFTIPGLQEPTISEYISMRKA